MAKSLEDTAFYRYHRLVSLNEVGGEPGNFGVSVSAFHHLMHQQQQRLPASMLTTATHDHKRGEDVRVRIDALSEVPLEWRRRVRRWARLNRFKVKEVDGRPVPGRNDAYLLYQMLVGSWPLGLGANDADGLAAYAERIVAYMIKASREAKQRTSWTAPEADYEAGVERFVRRILDPQDARAFLADLVPFQAQVALIGALNGLAQTLLKLTAPGVPDTYQGCELWDLSLVDPDNRRPVDFALHRAMLAQDADPAALLASWQDGRIKQHVVARTLALRRDAPALFAGDYMPLETTGLHAERLVAFARGTKNDMLIVIVPRLAARLLDGAEVPLPPASVWGDTQVTLSGIPGTRLRNPLTGQSIKRDSGLAAAQTLADLPVALLTTNQT
jgi:(1->4)-alpha-D-glucan 1-alpha-D-glucosylmutase